MDTKELLQTYYNGLAKKEGYESVLSDDFKFIGGDMTKQEPVVGKEAYIEILQRFSRLFTSMRIKEMIIENNSACVIASYDYTFPGGKTLTGNVAEIWKAESSKLNELTIFFDTLGFQNFLKP